MAFKLILSVLLMTVYSAQGQLSCTKLSSGATEYYSCLGNYQFTTCDTANPANTVTVQTTRTCSNGVTGPVPSAGDFGGSTSSTWCYPEQTKKTAVCGPAPPTCSSVGSFAAPSGYECTHFYTCVSNGGGISTLGACNELRACLASKSK